MSWTLLPLTVLLLSSPTLAQSLDQEAHPAVLSKVPSVQLELISENTSEYRLSLHNISSRTITAIRIERPYTGGKRSQENGDGTRPVIAPRGTLTIVFPLDNDPRPLQLIVTAALFDDDTYEGDPISAAAIVARRDGMRLQHSRIVEIVNGIMEQSELVDAEKIARIRTEVVRLPDSADAVTMNRLKARFPEVAVREWPLIADEVRGGMKSEKQGFAQNLDNFETQAKRTPATSSISAWWKSLRDMKNF